MNIHKIIKAVTDYKDITEKYYKLNVELSKVSGDFGPRVQEIDGKLAESIVDALDSVLLSLTGFPDLASYYLWDNIMGTGGWKITEVDGTEYTWNNHEQYRKVVEKMVSEHNKKDTPKHEKPDQDYKNPSDIMNSNGEHYTKAKEFFEEIFRKT